MSIDPNTLPEGAVVEIERCVFAIREDGQISSGFVGGVPFMPKKPITRVFVPVPDGMTLADAEAALADAGAWVEVEDFHDIPTGARCRSEWSRFAGKPSRSYVHRDDLPPADPDAVAGARHADVVEALVVNRFGAIAHGHVAHAPGDELAVDAGMGQRGATMAVDALALVHEQRKALLLLRGQRGTVALQGLVERRPVGQQRGLVELYGQAEEQADVGFDLLVWLS